MTVLGITGGVGSGKSRIVRLIAEVTGGRIFEADRAGHVVMDPGTECYEQVLEEFGQDLKLPDGKIDRKKLGGIVFNDRAKLEKLNSFIYPALDAMTDVFIEQAAAEGCPLVLLEAAMPGLKLSQASDEIWYVHADREVRIARLMDSRGYTRERCEEMISKQLSDAEYRGYAAEVIENSGAWEDTEDAVRKLCQRKFG